VKKALSLKPPLPLGRVQQQLRGLHLRLRLLPREIFSRLAALSKECIFSPSTRVARVAPFPIFALACHISPSRPTPPPPPPPTASSSLTKTSAKRTTTAPPSPSLISSPPPDAKSVVCIFFSPPDKKKSLFSSSCSIPARAVKAERLRKNVSPGSYAARAFQEAKNKALTRCARPRPAPT